MKKFLLPIAVLSVFFFASCGGDGDGDGDTPELTEDEKAYLAKVESVEQNNKALYIKSTGTLCPPCGDWGWQVHEGVINSASDYVTPFSAYGNWHRFAKDLTSQTSTIVDQTFGVNSFPSFLVNNGIGGRMGKANLQGNTVPDLTQSVLADIDAITGQTPIANAAINWEVSNNTLTAHTRTRFFEDAEGEFYISIWVDENGPTAPQAGYTNGIPAHKHVLRTAADQNAVFGVPLNNSGELMPQDTLIERTHTAEFPEGLWSKENTTVTAIIWNVTGNLTKAYSVVNASNDSFTEE